MRERLQGSSWAAAHCYTCPGCRRCSPCCSGWCAGSQDAISFLADWKPVKRVHIYAGVMVSNVYGGLANGFLNVQNIDPAAGIRVRF
jgi:hypothetical protein